MLSRRQFVAIPAVAAGAALTGFAQTAALTAGQVVERLVHSVDRLQVYVCGGGQTINRVRDTLVRKGMDRKSVKWEKFW